MTETMGILPFTQFNHSSSSTPAVIFPNNTVIKYRLVAKNGVGFGVYSTPNTDVLCDRSPTFMNKPVNIEANIQPYWIYLNWTHLVALTETGRDPPTYYHVQWDAGSSKSLWYDLTVESWATGIYS